MDGNRGWAALLGGRESRNENGRRIRKKAFQQSRRGRHSGRAQMARRGQGRIETRRGGGNDLEGRIKPAGEPCWGEGHNGARKGKQKCNLYCETNLVFLQEETILCERV